MPWLLKPWNSWTLTRFLIGLRVPKNPGVQKSATLLYNDINEAKVKIIF
jgi:hypothetical protein